MATTDVEIFKACADETGLRILVLLGEGQLCVCNIVDVLDMPHGKTSRHLAIVRRAGLVDDERRGTWLHYALSDANTPLMQRLHTYAKTEARQSPTACGNLDRLHELCACGKVCLGERETNASNRRGQPAAQLAEIDNP